jgi:hypothetical protein
MSNVHKYELPRLFYMYRYIVDVCLNKMYEKWKTETEKQVIVFLWFFIEYLLNKVMWKYSVCSVSETSQMKKKGKVYVRVDGNIIQVFIVGV